MTGLLKQMLFVCGIIIVSATGIKADSRMKSWQDFILLIKEDKFKENMIRPHLESLRKPIMDFINKVKEIDNWAELDTEPEIIKFNNKINCLINLTISNNKAEYCFTFVEENSIWYLEHIETIFIRLDKIPSLPVSEFPDVSDFQKAWASEEIYWSEQVRVFNFLKKEKGKEFAIDWFKDGMGYNLAAKTWVPFVEPQKAFVLYMCWEQRNLRGGEVVLEKLGDDEALVKVRPLLINIYLQSSHLKQQISWDNYIEIFFAIWKDRAEHAGWKLDFLLGDYLIGFHFKRDI